MSRAGGPVPTAPIVVRRRALRAAQQELRTSDTSTEATRTSRAVQGYLAATFDVPVAGLTPAESRAPAASAGRAAGRGGGGSYWSNATQRGLPASGRALAGELCDEAERLLDALDAALDDRDSD